MLKKTYVKNLCQQYKTTFNKKKSKKKQNKKVARKKQKDIDFSKVQRQRIIVDETHRKKNIIFWLNNIL